MRWDQGIGWNYSTRWDENTGLAGSQDGLRPYRSPSTRFLRTREEKQNEFLPKSTDWRGKKRNIRMNNMRCNLQPSISTGLLVHHENTRWVIMTYAVKVYSYFNSVCQHVQKTRSVMSSLSKAVRSHRVSLHTVNAEWTLHSNTVKEIPVLSLMHWHTRWPHPCIRPVLPQLWLEEGLKESRGRHCGLILHTVKPDVSHGYVTAICHDALCHIRRRHVESNVICSNFFKFN